jgi:hypothetical protein
MNRADEIGLMRSVDQLVRLLRAIAIVLEDGHVWNDSEGQREVTSLLYDPDYEVLP